MPKGNNAVPHTHGRKHWHPCSSQAGNIKTWLDQPKRKERRRRLRIQKAKKAFPRPLRSFRPQVACPTVRYNAKKRLGRGFSVSELKAVNIKPKYARTIGIRVDFRRKNLSEEGLSANVQRLKQYVSKLVLFPINHKKLRKGEASDAETKNVKQDRTRFGTGVASHPATVKAALEAPRKLTADEKKKTAYKFLKKNISAVRFIGQRMKLAQKKADKAAAAAKKADK
jgi:large subunit ribosomal protein L13e